jgi:hypothetical protein
VWYWVGGAIAVVCVGLSIALTISFFSSLVDDLTGPLTEFRAPGETTLELPADADRTIYRKLRESGTPLAPGAPDPSCNVASPSGGQVEVGDTFEWTLKRSGDRYEAIQDFSAATAGAYRVACTVPGGSRDVVPVAIGESIGFWDLIRKGAAAFALFFGGLVVGGGIAAATGIMRSNHRSRLQRERAAAAAPPPPAAS